MTEFPKYFVLRPPGEEKTYYKIASKDGPVFCRGEEDSVTRTETTLFDLLLQAKNDEELYEIGKKYTPWE